MASTRGEQRFLGRAYLEHLTDADLRRLGAFVGTAGAGTAATMRRRSELIREMLTDPAVVREVLAPPGPEAGRVGTGLLTPSDLAPVSPFLTFAAAVERCRAELASAPRRRVVRSPPACAGARRGQGSSSSSRRSADASSRSVMTPASRRGRSAD